MSATIEYQRRIHLSELRYKGGSNLIIYLTNKYGDDYTGNHNYRANKIAEEFAMFGLHCVYEEQYRAFIVYGDDEGLLAFQLKWA